MYKKVTKDKEPIELTDMSFDELIAQRNEIENAIDNEVIIDPIETAQAMSRVREIDQLLIAKHASVDQLSKITLEYFAKHNQESHIQLSVLEEELRRRKKK